MGFALGLPAAAGIRLTVPVYYALGDSRTPVKVAAASMIVFVAAGLALMTPLGHLGLALAISLSSVVNLGLLLGLLGRRLGGLGLGAAAVYFAAAWLLRCPELGELVRSLRPRRRGDEATGP